MEKYDVAIVGGGVVGGMIFRELSRYQLRVCLLEKERDVAMGSSRANTGLVHGGFDAKTGSEKAKYNLLGRQLMSQTAKELGVKYENNGALVVAFSEEEMKEAQALYERGLKNGVEDLEIIDAETLSALEPNVKKGAIGALHCKSAGIVCPYELTIAAIGNAMDNGGELLLDFEVVDMQKREEFTLTAKDGRRVQAKLVVNAAGLFADKIAGMVGDTSFTIGARKGEYILLDKGHAHLFTRTLFFCPSEQGKGIVITRTVDGNILLGPTADEVEDKTDKRTTEVGLADIRKKAAQMSDEIPFYDTITSFAGLRAFSSHHDFIIEESGVCKNLLHAAGIESPGLTASPAIGKRIAELVGERLPLVEKENFNPNRAPDYFFKNLSTEEKNEVIKKDKSYGKIVCRCEEITLGEILRAIRENPKAATVDGIKRRTRAGMGRCQGGFCQPTIVEILAKELGVSVTEIEKDEKGSVLLVEEGK